MHKTIKKFSMDGIVGDDSLFAQVRGHYERMIVIEMRDKGYVPVLDLGPYWATEYDINNDRYEFFISVYGIHVGRRKAWQIEGVTNGRLIPRSTTPNKSKPSSEPAE